MQPDHLTTIRRVPGAVVAGALAVVSVPTVLGAMVSLVQELQPHPQQSR